MKLEQVVIAEDLSSLSNLSFELSSNLDSSSWKESATTHSWASKLVVEAASSYVVLDASVVAWKLFVASVEHPCKQL